MFSQPDSSVIQLGRIGHPGSEGALHFGGFVRAFNTFNIAL